MPQSIEIEIKIKNQVHTIKRSKRWLSMIYNISIK